ncbi:MAG TPA: nitroreductase family protein [Nitrospiria bacterium]|nr:nitroreductase family protein [Nitrospiria bacterium]
MTQPLPLTTIMEAINQRRSVRSFSPQPVDRADIRALLAAAVRAPTAVHEEPWAFSIIQDATALRRLSDRAKPLFLEEAHRAHLDRGGHAFDRFASPDFNIFYNAGTLIVICGRLGGPFVIADCWLAAENLMLAACAMGLGTCVIGSALPALNAPEVKAGIGIPPDCSAVAPIIVGVPSGETPLSPRKEPVILSWT